jgi:hypothetical protein
MLGYAVNAALGYCYYTGRGSWLAGRSEACVHNNLHQLFSWLLPWEVSPSGLAAQGWACPHPDQSHAPATGSMKATNLCSQRCCYGLYGVAGQCNEGTCISNTFLWNQDQQLHHMPTPGSCLLNCAFSCTPNQVAAPPAVVWRLLNPTHHTHTTSSTPCNCKHMIS